MTVPSKRLSDGNMRARLLTSNKKDVYKRTLALKPLNWFLGTGLCTHNLCVIDREFKMNYFFKILDLTITLLLAVPI
jgi:hypothetical protein